MLQLYHRRFKYFTDQEYHAMAGQKTRVLGQADIAQMMTMADYIEAVEGAFLSHGAGQMLVPAVVHIPAPNGAFHIKSAAVVGDVSYVAVKVNGNFPDNPARHGLPTIQGAIVFCDGRNGALLAVIDSIEVTAMRTAAATGVAAKYLAARNSTVLTVIGCGIQGRVQLLALKEVLPLTTVYAFDLDHKNRDRFTEQMRAETGLEINAVDDLAGATLASQVVVTCTSSRAPFLRREHIAPGTFIAAVGADNDDKQELDSALMRESKVIADIADQCAQIGELHHALAANAMTRADVVAELAGIVSGTVKPEFAADDVIVFDSTGSAIQDVAAAAIIYERAVAADIGLSVTFA
jgi:alanine dehydrogenase